MHLYRSIKSSNTSAKIKYTLYDGLVEELDLSQCIIDNGSISTVQYESGGNPVVYTIAIKGSGFTTAEQFKLFFPNTAPGVDDYEINGIQDIGNGYYKISIVAFNGDLGRNAALAMGVLYNDCTEIVDFGGSVNKLLYGSLASVNLKTAIFPAVTLIDRQCFSPASLGARSFNLEKLSLPALQVLNVADNTARVNLFHDYNSVPYFKEGTIIEVPRSFQTCNAGAIHPELQICLDSGLIIGWLD